MLRNKLINKGSQYLYGSLLTLLSYVDAGNYLKKVQQTTVDLYDLDRVCEYSSRNGKLTGSPELNMTRFA